MTLKTNIQAIRFLATVLLLLCFGNFKLRSQNPLLDSANIISKLKDDTVKIKLIARLITAYSTIGEYEKAEVLIE